MGIYLNPGNENFKIIVSSGNYVDKTSMISTINSFIDKGNNYICVSRPRRFGKTIAGNMLTAYYSKGCDSRDLFSSFNISKSADFEDKLNKYNVIKIDMNGAYQNIRDKENLIIILEDKIKAEIDEEFPEAMVAESDSLAEAILKVYSKTSENFIIIIDEYDVLVREQVSEEQFGRFLSMLNGLFKDDTLRPAISFAYLTGILPIVRDKIQSKLNNFEEYTFLDAYELSEFIGFTKEEVRKLCDDAEMDFEQLRRWYDGYHQNGFDIYNPESVIKAVTKKKYGSYWGKTSTYEAISDRVKQNFKGAKDDIIKMLSEEEVEVNITSYLNTMNSFISKDDMFTYLIHLGYLAYDSDKGTCRIPNREVRGEWLNAIAATKGYETTDEIIKESKTLLEETINGNEEAVARALDRSHIHVTSNRSYNNEDALQSAIYLAYIYALNMYTVIKEMTTGKGFADVVFIPYVPDMPALVIELKKDKSPESALNQIKDKKYFSSLEHYQGDMLLVGIDYNEDTKEHRCKIERYNKMET